MKKKAPIKNKLELPYMKKYIGNKEFNRRVE